MRKFTKPSQLADGELIRDFQCGNDVVDSWVRNHAAHARKNGTAVVYVTRCGEDVAGFYTLSAHSVCRVEVSGGWFVRNAPTQVPAVLLGMLGVDFRYKGCGLGAQLLRDAILNAMKIAELAGARALIVDPVDGDAATFYAHFGFVELPGTKRMALKLK